MLMNGDEVVSPHMTCSPRRTSRHRWRSWATRQLPGSAGGSLATHDVSLLSSGGSAVPSAGPGS